MVTAAGMIVYFDFIVPEDLPEISPVAREDSEALISCMLADVCLSPRTRIFVGGKEVLSLTAHVEGEWEVSYLLEEEGGSPFRVMVTFPGDPPFILEDNGGTGFVTRIVTGVEGGGVVKLIPPDPRFVQLFPRAQKLYREAIEIAKEVVIPLPRKNLNGRERRMYDEPNDLLGIQPSKG